MASFIAYGSAEYIDMSLADFGGLLDGRVKAMTKSMIKISYGSFDETILRGRFQFDKQGDLTRGTVSNIEFGHGDLDGTELTGLRVDLGALLKVAKTLRLSDDTALLGQMLSGDDQVSGSFKSCNLKGFDGNDRLIARWGSDSLDGGSGNDSLYGGAGKDTLIGGLGMDTFVYEESSESREDEADTVADFSQADGDKIDLTGMGFFNFADDIHFTHSSGNTVMEVGPAGGFFNLFIRFSGVVIFTEADFNL